MGRHFLALFNFVTLMIKRFLCLFFILNFVALFIASTQLIIAGEDESIDDLSDKAPSNLYDRRIFEHEHLFDFRLRDTL